VHFDLAGVPSPGQNAHRSRRRVWPGLLVLPADREGAGRDSAASVRADVSSISPAGFMAKTLLVIPGSGELALDLTVSGGGSGSRCLSSCRSWRSTRSPVQEIQSRTSLAITIDVVNKGGRERHVAPSPRELSIHTQFILESGPRGGLRREMTAHPRRHRRVPFGP
jgi:hypothetical protein